MRLACAEQGLAAFIATLKSEGFPSKEAEGQGHLAWRANPHDATGVIGFENISEPMTITNRCESANGMTTQNAAKSLKMG
jgi:hypothetical protein